MRKQTYTRYSEWSLKSKLFANMLLLTGLILVILTAGMLLFGRTNSIAKTYYDTLDIQMAVFEKDIATHFDSLAVSAIALSGDMTSLVEQYLEAYGLTFQQLSDTPSDSIALQEQMLEPLRQKLLQTDASGAFVMLNATVHSSASEQTRTGLYLQINGYRPAYSEMILYRGQADIARAHDIALHRKWQLEFHTDALPEYEHMISAAAYPPDEAYWITSPFTLPGTSDQVILLTVPIRGENGTLYGICGFELSSSFFAAYHNQPTRLPHLSCLLTSSRDNALLTEETLVCGGVDGYFHTMTERYSVQSTDGGLSRFSDDSFTYIGLTKPIRLSSPAIPDAGEHLLAVMIPAADYEHAQYRSFVQTAVLVLLIAFFTVSCCRYFSRRFLSPVLSALDRIKSDDREKTNTRIPEILDLIDYLSKQEQQHDAARTALEQENASVVEENHRLEAEYAEALTEFNRVQAEYTRAQDDLARVQKEIERLAYARKTEIDPDDYRNFLAGLQTLTTAERNIFELYLSGKSANEILSLTGIKESTLKYHNHNILGKLGVSSRKQMLRYAELMRHQRDDLPAD